MNAERPTPIYIPLYPSLFSVLLQGSRQRKVAIHQFLVFIILAASPGTCFHAKVHLPCRKMGDKELMSRPRSPYVHVTVPRMKFRCASQQICSRLDAGYRNLLLALTQSEHAVSFSLYCELGSFFWHPPTEATVSLKMNVLKQHGTSNTQKSTGCVCHKCEGGKERENYKLLLQ